MLPRDVQRCIVSFIACGGPEVLSEKLQQYTKEDKCKMFDVLDATTLSSTIAGHNLSIHLRRYSDMSGAWSLMCFWSKEDRETGNFTFCAEIAARISNGSIPPLIELAPRSVRKLPPLIVRAFDERSEGHMISTQYF